MADVWAAIVLRCEESLATFFPEPVTDNMDELIERQRAASAIRRKLSRDDQDEKARHSLNRPGFPGGSYL